ncbi:hypothetical protein ACWY4P_40505 [Streptomyces sp. LZ34]
MSTTQATPTAEPDSYIDSADETETMMERDGYMRPPKAAKDLGCGVRWLTDGANHHGFPHTRMGQSMWFSPEDRATIRKLCQVPAQPAKMAQFRRGRSKGATRKPALAKSAA